jgi:hypothetical protein
MIKQCAGILITVTSKTTDKELEDLWNKRNEAQKAINEFLEDNLSSEDLEDVFRFCKINPIAFEQAFLSNVEYLYGRTFALSCRN